MGGGSPRAGGGYLAPGAGRAQRQLRQRLAGRRPQVPPLDLQRVRGGAAGPERAGHLHVVSLPHGHILGDFGKRRWGRGRGKRDQVRGGAWGARVAGLRFPPWGSTRGPGHSKVRQSGRRAAAETGSGVGCFLRGAGDHGRLAFLTRAPLPPAGLGRAGSAPSALGGPFTAPPLPLRTGAAGILGTPLLLRGDPGSWPRRPQQGLPTLHPRQRSPRAHRRPPGAAGRAAAAAAGVRGRRAGSAVPSPAGGAGARARRGGGGGSAGSDPAPLRLGPLRACPGPAAPHALSPAAARQSRSLARSSSRLRRGRRSGCAAREAPPRGCGRSARASLCPRARRAMESRRLVSARPAGQGLGRAGTHPWPRERAPRLGAASESRLPGSGGRARLPPPPAPAAAPPGPPQDECALSRGPQTWRRT